MSEVKSYEIKEALARMHSNREFFMTEVKNGPSYVAKGELLQFDAVAIFKSWSHMQIRGYEIKVSRSDFLRDAKYSRYLPYFHEFYFVVPKGMVQRQEVEENIGLMWYNPETGNITTKKRAVWRDIEVDPLMLLYIIMYRIDSDRAPFMLHKDEAFRAWLEGKETTKQLSYRVKSKLIEENVELQKRVEHLQETAEAEKELNALRSVLAKHGIKSFWHESLAEQLDEALSRQYPTELDDIRSAAQRVVTNIDQLKFKIEKEAANQ